MPRGRHLISGPHVAEIVTRWRKRRRKLMPLPCPRVGASERGCRFPTAPKRQRLCRSPRGETDCSAPHHLLPMAISRNRRPGHQLSPHLSSRTVPPLLLAHGGPVHPPPTPTPPAKTMPMRPGLPTRQHHHRPLGRRASRSCWRDTRRRRGCAAPCAGSRSLCRRSMHTWTRAALSPQWRRRHAPLHRQ